MHLDNASPTKPRRPEYDRIAAEHPALLAKLLLNVGMPLASRVRALIAD